jgi:hypothetical protein
MLDPPIFENESKARKSLLPSEISMTAKPVSSSTITSSFRKCYNAYARKVSGGGSSRSASTDKPRTSNS